MSEDQAAPEQTRELLNLFIHNIRTAIMPLPAETTAQHWEEVLAMVKEKTISEWLGIAPIESSGQPQVRQES